MNGKMREKFTTAGLLLLLLGGCAGHQKRLVNVCQAPECGTNGLRCYEEISGAGCLTSCDLETRKEVGAANERILKKNFAEEWEYLGGRAPELGLALSGGGTRSASFNIGVMKALQEKGILDEVEVISSVSGGSYASYWYFMQNYYLNREGLPNLPASQVSSIFSCTDASDSPCKEYKNARDDFAKRGAASFFADKEYCGEKDSVGSKLPLNDLAAPDAYKFQYVLQQSSDIMSFEKKPGIWRTVRNYGQQTGNFVVYLGSLPLHWIFNGLFDFKANLNPYRHFYQNGLERTYGYVPLSYNLRSFVNDEEENLSPRVNARDLSFRDLADYLEAHGKHDGAQVDGRLPYFIINATVDYANRSLRSSKKKLTEAVYEFTPWSCGSGLSGYVPAEECPDISLGRAVSISGAAIDGQSESIDAAGRSEGEIVAVSELLNVLNLDLGYNIPNHSPSANPELGLLRKMVCIFPLYRLFDDQTLSDLHLSDGGHIDNLGIYSLVRRGVKKVVAVDAEEDGQSVYSSLMRLKRNLQDEMGLDLDWESPNTPALDVYYLPPSGGIVRGTISGLIGEGGREQKIDLVYVKLSIKRDDLKTGDDPCRDRYPYSVVSYAREHDRFPLESTTDIFYDDRQYRAYRDLGYTIASHIEAGKLKAQVQ
ncbi:MAG: patatin-like phospholipase family protein [Proteobacteria bacterium]|nr:patatin-like phospholipase family protein [Pseudomonadota bacterium]MBU1688758.1 patatin-like phospholipase family protein [Pseudomonadota bacterium]